MADLHIGPGQTYATFALAYAASGAGDRFLFHTGTHVVAAQIGKANQTVTTAGDGDVVLDAGGAAYVFRVWGASGLAIGEAPGDVLRLQGASSYVIDHWQGNGMTLDGLTIKVNGAYSYCVSLGGVAGGGTGAYVFNNLRLRGVEDGSGVSGRGVWVQTSYPGSTFTGDGVDILGCEIGIWCKYSSKWQRVVIRGGTGTRQGYGFYYSPSCTIKNGKFYDMNRAFYNYSQWGPALLNCTFDDNTHHLHLCGAMWGAKNCAFTNGAISIYPSPQTFTNCLFWNTTGHTGHTRTNCVTGTVSPYVDRAARDFHLFEGSEAVDVGVNIAGPAWNNVNDDFDGVSRPQGVEFDIGAYEFPVSTGWGGKICGADVASFCGAGIASVCGG